MASKPGSSGGASYSPIAARNMTLRTPPSTPTTRAQPSSLKSSARRKAIYLRRLVREEYDQLILHRGIDSANDWKVNKEVVLKVDHKLESTKRTPSPWIVCQPEPDVKPAEGHSFSKTKCTTIITTSSGEVKTAKTLMVVVNPVKSIPKMNFYNYVSQNYKVKDGAALLNMPYLGDDQDEKKSNCFYKELLEGYDGKLHCEHDVNWIDDEILVELMKVMIIIEHEGPRNETTVAPPSETRIQFSIDDTFQAISANFAGNGTADDIKKKYLELTSKTESSTAPYAEHYSSNIDGKSSELLTRKQALHSFSSLLCRRCYIYDCRLHREERSPSHPLPKADMRNEPDKAPCGPDCFLYLGGVKKKEGFTQMPLDEYQTRTHVQDPEMTVHCGEESQWMDSEDDDDDLPIVIHETKPKPSTSTVLQVTMNTITPNCAGANGRDPQQRTIAMNTKKEPTAIPISGCFTGDGIDPVMATFRGIYDGWSGVEVSLFRSIYKAYPGNYCVLSKLLMSKSCQDVYHFVQQDESSREQTTLEGQETDVDEDSNSAASGKKSSKAKNRLRDWNNHTRKIRQEAGKESVAKTHFVPCKHPGEECSLSCNCNCVLNGKPCEKFCHCDLDCKNRFPGCACKAQCNTKLCPCYLDCRECDPDLCRSCGLVEHDSTKIKCKNVCIQRGIHKHLLVGESAVSGWGIFLKEAAKKNEFIGEYLGELITDFESDRRGKVYDANKCSYLFDLNNEYVVDATKKGNKLRFANHSSKNPNCYGKVLLVNSDHRIGIFAKRDIAANEELFFDYGKVHDGVWKREFIPVEREIENGLGTGPSSAHAK